jgi:hypothetical protein
MFKNFSFFTKHPYTAGVIAMAWISTAFMIDIDTHLPIVKMATINVIYTTAVAAIGFRGTR